MLKSFVLGLPILGMLACGQSSPLPAPASPSDSNVSIYGGSKVTAEEQVSKFTVLLMQNNATVCTGVLLSERLVVSAAHCYYLLNPNRPAYVGFGLKDKNAKQIRIANFVPNAAFNSKAGQLGGVDIEVNDISLIQMSEDAPEGYEPVEVMTEADAVSPGESVLLAGFGKTDVKTGFLGWNTVVGELYQVETKLLFEAPVAKEVWFGDVPGKGACNGDSGGPAVVARGGEWKLLGVTSRGRDCRSEYIYTDLRYFQRWIADTAASFGA